MTLNHIHHYSSVFGLYQSPSARLDPVNLADGLLAGDPLTGPASKPTPLGSTCEIIFRSEDFARFSRENPTSARFALQSEARDLLPNERVRNCLRARVSKSDPVSGLYVPATKSAHFGNLQTCGSVWSCPVCAAKVTSRRREELGQAVDIWTGQGNSVLLASFTLQHLKADNCLSVLLAILKAFSRFWDGRPGQRIIGKYKLAGRVRGLEVTYTIANGWHWHFHVLLFVTGQADPLLIQDMKGEFTQRWQYLLAKDGRFADSDHGVDIRFTDQDVADYVSKYGVEGGPKIGAAQTWTEAHELALAPIKRAAKGGFTAHQLLGLSLCGDKQAGRLFVEYHQAVKGRRQLQWSKGLRDLLGMRPEKTDEEIAAQQEQNAVELARFEREHWRVILANDARADVLKALKTGDSWAVLEFCESLGLMDVYYPQLVLDPNYIGPHRAVARFEVEYENFAGDG